MKMNKISTKVIILIITLGITILWGINVEAQPFFTKEELYYIDKIKTIKAVSLKGAAPIQYSDKDGQVKGISKEVLEESGAYKQGFNSDWK